jgi:hypothetical protein
MYVMLWATLVAGVAIFSGLPGRATLTLVATIVGIAANALGWIVGMIWLWCGWSERSREERRGVSSLGMMLRLLVPFYGQYWMFALHRRFCAALEARAAAAGKSPRRLFRAALLPLMASLLGWFSTDAPIVWVPCTLAAAIGWQRYMARCDDVRRGWA